MKKYSLGIINTGFMCCYLEYLKRVCGEKQIKYDIFDDYKNIENPDKYDFIIVDSNIDKYKSDCCYIFHGHTNLHKIKQSNKFYEIIYLLLHQKKLRKQKKLFETAKLIFVMSEIVKRDLVKNCSIDSKKIIVIHPGFIKNKDNDLLTIPKLDYSRVFNVSMSAAGFITKGGFLLLRAVRFFRKLYPSISIKFNIIYPKYKSNLGVILYMKLFKLDKYVNFLEYQSDMDTFYNNADCVVCASLAEAFGRVVTEAMYAKRPVIVSSDVGASEIIKDGENGFIFEAGKNSAHNLALKIKEVYDKYNSLENVINNAYNTAKPLDWENFATKLVNCLSE